MEKLKHFDWVNVLLIFLPLTVAFEYMHFDPLWIFLGSAAAIIPLAKWMGVATEELSYKMGEGLGGLMNATFGNATELIIAIFALQRGLIEVVEASITGSIVSNFLFVLGLSMIAGGWKRDKQVFNRTAASVNASLLTIAIMGLVLPAMFALVSKNAGFIVLEEVSMAVAALLIICYVLSLWFSLKTHKHLYIGGKHAGEAEEHGLGWSTRRAILTLLVATVAIAFMSEMLVGVIEHVAEAAHMSQFFIGVILIPLIGNAAEHLTAVTVAAKDKMDLALNIALGSSAQIALFVAPLLVFISFAIGHPMQLVFNELEVVSIAVAVFIMDSIVHDGESHWLEGVLLVVSYLIIAIVFFFLM
ncbi:TPA: calcium/proton exchanger [Candidatus Bathyarchaeota archaeon]|nr:calcium/proton exchanger [Candidatus Bathyarchaeota archaeon]